MKKARYSEEQIVRILREADRDPVAEVAKRHGVSEQSIYGWRNAEAVSMVLHTEIAADLQQRYGVSSETAVRLVAAASAVAGSIKGVKATDVVGGVPQITLNRQSDVAFERQVTEALGHVGGVKNTNPVTVQLPNGAQVTTIPDLWGTNVGGLLEVKNVQNLSMSNQLRAQIQVATAIGQPLNLVVSPRTNNISRELLRQVRGTGGDVFRYNPTTGDLTKF